MDSFKNFAETTVTSGYDASATSIAVSDASVFPTAPFNATWWESDTYPNPADDPNREIVRVTARSSNTLTVTRGQEVGVGGQAATTKNTSGKTYRIAAPLTALTANALFPNTALSGDVSSVGFVTTIAAGAVSASKLATNAVDLSTSVVTGILQAASMPALTGDVTNSAGALSTTISANAITLAKMATMATDSILGRATNGTGNVEVLTALPWAFTGDVTSVADANALTIATNAVVTAKILDANVTLAKLANIATASVLGRNTAGTGVPEVLTTLPNGVQDNITRLGIITNTSTKLSAFAVTTSAELAGVISDETGSGFLVFATSPTLTTPTLGVASATSINKVTITAPASSAILTIANSKTLTASNTLTLAGTDSTIITFQGTDTYVGRDTTDTLTNKTLTTPTIASFTNATHNHTNAAGGGTLTLSGAAFANQGTTTQVLHGNGSGNPSWSAVSLTADVSGTLPLGNGGTGLTAVPGSDTYVLFNDGGVFGADAQLTYSKSGDLLSLTQSPGANTAPTQGIELKNSTAATSGNQQWSTGLFFDAQGFKTNATAASQSVRLRQYLKPIQGSASPGIAFNWDLSTNGAAFTNLMTLSELGTVQFAGHVQSGANMVSGGNVTAAAGSTVGFNARSSFTSSANGAGAFTNNAGTAPAYLLQSLLISAKTTDYSVTALDCGTYFTNTGASGTVNFTLVTAVAGYEWEFYAAAAQIIKITAPASTTIEYNGTVSASAGNAQSASAVAGVYMRVVCISSTKYVITPAVGSITIT